MGLVRLVIEDFMKKHSSIHKKRENIWQIQEAKAKFSEVIENANEYGFQTITKNGEPIAVILSKKEYDQMTLPKNSFIEFFRDAPYPEIELESIRSKDLPRKVNL